MTDEKRGLPWRRKPSRIFINYRRDDTRGVAGRLVDSLQVYFGDDRVFRDVEGIRGGADFGDVIQSTLGTADAVIVLIGESWLTLQDEQGRRRLDNPDDWVAREIVDALEAGVPVFPVLIDDTPMPRAEDLREELRPLVRYNAISISDKRWHTDVDRLAKIVAIDMPGSVAERKLNRVRLAASMLLLLAIGITTASLVSSLYVYIRDQRTVAHSNDLLSQAMSGLTYMAIVGSSILVLMSARWIDESRRRYAFAGGLIGIIGTGVFFVLSKPVPLEYETIVNFLGSTIVATSMFVLMNLSGFKPR